MQNNRICYITTLNSTIASFFLDQLGYLANKGFIVDVIGTPNVDISNRLPAGVNLIPLNIPRGISIIGTLNAIKCLIKLFKDNNYSLIQYSTPNAALCSSIAGWIAKVKVRNYHLMGFRYLSMRDPIKSLFKNIERLTCTLSTSIECVSKSNMICGIENKIFPSNKATVVWNGSSGGVNLNRFDYSNKDAWRTIVRDKLGIESDCFVYGFVGRINKDKGVLDLLKAFTSIADPAILLMVGRMEDYDNEIRNEISKLSSRIIVLDVVNDIERYYAAMDILVLPSYREGFGNVIIEAAAMGLPAIVSNIPGPIDAIIANKTAITITPGDIADLTEKMRMVYNNHLLSENDCVTFVRDSFDSEVLSQKVFERKMSLLREGLK